MMRAATTAELDRIGHRTEVVCGWLAFILAAWVVQHQWDLVVDVFSNRMFLGTAAVYMVARLFPE